MFEENDHPLSLSEPSEIYESNNSKALEKFETLIGGYEFLHDPTENVISWSFRNASFLLKNNVEKLPYELLFKTFDKFGNLLSKKSNVKLTSVEELQREGCKTLSNFIRLFDQTNLDKLPIFRRIIQFIIVFKDYNDSVLELIKEIVAKFILIINESFPKEDVLTDPLSNRRVNRRKSSITVSSILSTLDDCILDFLRIINHFLKQKNLSTDYQSQMWVFETLYPFFETVFSLPSGAIHRQTSSEIIQFWDGFVELFNIQTELEFNLSDTLETVLISCLDKGISLMCPNYLIEKHKNSQNKTVNRFICRQINRMKRLSNQTEAEQTLENPVTKKMKFTEGVNDSLDLEKQETSSQPNNENVEESVEHNTEENNVEESGKNGDKSKNVLIKPSIVYKLKSEKTELANDSKISLRSRKIVEMVKRKTENPDTHKNTDETNKQEIDSKTQDKQMSNGIIRNNSVQEKKSIGSRVRFSNVDDIYTVTGNSFEDQNLSNENFFEPVKMVCDDDNNDEVKMSNNEVEGEENNKENCDDSENSYADFLGHSQSFVVSSPYNKKPITCSDKSIAERIENSFNDFNRFDPINADDTDDSDDYLEVNDELNESISVCSPWDDRIVCSNIRIAEALENSFNSKVYKTFRSIEPIKKSPVKVEYEIVDINNVQLTEVETALMNQQENADIDEPTVVCSPMMEKVVCCNLSVAANMRKSFMNTSDSQLSPIKSLSSDDDEPQSAIDMSISETPTKDIHSIAYQLFQDLNHNQIKELLSVIIQRL